MVYGDSCEHENLTFKEHIGLLVSSEAAGWEKPDPSIFLHTARQLDLSPAQCVYIGDHPLNDVTGAAAAGMRSIWLSGFHPWPEHLPAPAARVASLEDVLPLLGEFPPAIARVDEGQASTPATTT